MTTTFVCRGQRFCWLGAPSKKKKAQLLTRFRTGRATRLPRLKSHTWSITENHRNARSYPRCPSSHRVTLTFPRPRVKKAQATLFHFVVENKVKKRWFAIQGTTAAHHTPLLPSQSLQVGNHQCSAGPAFGAGWQKIRLVLIRVDGRRWLSKAMFVRIP